MSEPRDGGALRIGGTPVMIVIRILLNGLIMAAEIAAVAAVAWLGYHHPFLFAALTAGLSVLLGLRLETKGSPSSCRSISRARGRRVSSSSGWSALWKR